MTQSLPKRQAAEYIQKSVSIYCTKFFTFVKKNILHQELLI